MASLVLVTQGILEFIGVDIILKEMFSEAWQERYQLPDNHPPLTHSKSRLEVKLKYTPLLLCGQNIEYFNF